MRWKNARRSENVDDRRGRGLSPKAKGGGIMGIIMAIIAIFVFKQDPTQVISSTMQNMRKPKAQVDSSEIKDPVQEELKAFVETVLAYTEDVWEIMYPEISRAYLGQRRQYVDPTLHLFTGQVTTQGCGVAGAAMGPFYCPGDNGVYIDLSFYEDLKRKFKAPGDFAQAYVIAHEVGHHVQNLLGISDKVHQQRSRISKIQYNQLSVRMELQADYFAGCWAHRAQKRWNILEPGDVDEGLTAAWAIGDDTITKRMGGRVVAERFTHGSAKQRVRWFKRGLESGDPTAYDPFDGRYEDL